MCCWTGTFDLDCFEGEPERLTYHQVRMCFLRRFTYTGDTSTHAQGTDPRVALGAEGELP